MIVVYLIGVAGVGKTTVVTKLAEPWKLRTTQDKPFAHRHYTTEHGKAVILGRDTQPFGGTDTLSWTAINHVDRFMQVCRERRINLIIGEGDRFANDRFMEAATLHGTLLLYNLQTPGDISEKRRGGRSAQWNTKPQNEQWVAGRLTKTQRLADRWNATPIDATPKPETIAQTIREDIRCRSNDHA